MPGTLRLGAFIIAGLAVFAGAIFIIGGRQMLFSRTYDLNAQFKNVAGLGDGADVRVAGIRKGTVRRVDLPSQPDQKVRVEMALDDATRNVIKQDSTAMIRAAGLMGDEYIEISVGSQDAPKVTNGYTLEGVSPVEISDLIKKADGLLETAGGTLQNVNATAGNLQAITAKVNQGTGTIGALVNDRKIYENVAQSTEELKDDMEAAKHNFLLSHFFHKRGYEDPADLTKNEIAALPANGEASKVFLYDANKIFDKPDEAKLKDSKALNEAGAYLQSNTFGLVVAAASVEKGDTDKVRTLTEARASVIRKYLVDNFKLDDTKFKTIGLGKSTEIPGGKGVAVFVYTPRTAPDKPLVTKR